MRIKILSTFLICCLFLLVASCKAAGSDTSVEPSASETASNEAAVFHFIQPGYSSNQLHTIWDMKIYNDCLYIGVGDFDKNISPGVAKRYRLNENRWENCGTIPDEQIGRFVVIDGKLMIPGFDPTEDWTLGNYYSLDGDVFTTYRLLPGGIHCFDLAKYDNVFFAALGVNRGNMPVVSTERGDEKFSSVPFTDADGNSLSTQPYTEVRAYDFVTLGQTLYAVIKLDDNMQVYKYENGAFVYHANLNNKLVISRVSYLPITEKAVLDDAAFLTTGRLYRTENMFDFSDITPDNIDLITDLLVYNGTLYALANTKTESGYTLSVLCYNADRTFYTIKTVPSSLLGMSFEYDGEQWYIAIGGIKEQNHNDAGKILCIS